MEQRFSHRPRSAPVVLRSGRRVLRQIADGAGAKIGRGELTEPLAGKRESSGTTKAVFARESEAQASSRRRCGVAHRRDMKEQPPRRRRIHEHPELPSNVSNFGSEFANPDTSFIDFGLRFAVQR